MTPIVKLAHLLEHEVKYLAPGYYLYHMKQALSI